MNKTKHEKDAYVLQFWQRSKLNLLSPSGKCSNIITKAFHDKVDPNGDKWATLSKETKIFYWEEFQLITQSRLLGNIRPNKEEFKKKSEQNKKSRRKGVVGGKAPPTHNGGSASHKKIALDMEEYTEKAPSVYDVFMFTHTKDHDGKTFLDDKVKKVHDFIESRRADLELLGEEVDENELFYTAIGGHDHNRRIYGLGLYGISIFPIDSSKTCSSPDTNYEKHHLETKIQKLEETIVQQRIDLDEVRNTSNDMRNATN
ncbi:unnamed protein product [Lactuca saligna]|uniref:Uncharacterized protein n=1 Tax=Lactuca saligna TaxID=75948 RepID=A0AA35VMN0_LACSI|nr:unnamed protein product [Lactuca saligna]